MNTNEIKTFAVGTFGAVGISTETASKWKMKQNPEATDEKLLKRRAALSL